MNPVIFSPPLYVHIPENVTLPGMDVKENCWENSYNTLQPSKEAEWAVYWLSGGAYSKPDMNQYTPEEKSYEPDLFPIRGMPPSPKFVKLFGDGPLEPVDVKQASDRKYADGDLTWVIQLTRRGRVSCLIHAIRENKGLFLVDLNLGKRILGLCAYIKAGEHLGASDEDLMKGTVPLESAVRFLNSRQLSGSVGGDSKRCIHYQSLIKLNKDIVVETT